MVRRFRAQVLSRESDAVRELSVAYQRMEKSTRKRLLSLLREIGYQEAQGVPVDARQRYLEERLTEILPQIRDEIARLSDRGVLITESGQTSLIALAPEHAEAVAKAAIGPPPEPGLRLSFNRLDRGAVEALVGAASDGSPLANVFAAAGRDLSLQIRQAMVDGVAQGQNPRTVAKTIAAAYGQSRNRYETICRTELQRAYRESTRGHYEANPGVVRGMRRNCVGDSRSCPACFALHGREYTVEESIHSHPSCRCFLTPLTRSWGEVLGRPDLPDTRPALPSGAELFDRLTDADRRTVLGPERYARWEAGNLPIGEWAETSFDPRWGPSVRVRPLPPLSESPN